MHLKGSLHPISHIEACLQVWGSTTAYDLKKKKKKTTVNYFVAPEEAACNLM